MAINIKFPVYTFDGAHYVKHLNPCKCVVVFPNKRVEVESYNELTTGYFDTLIIAKKHNDNIEVSEEYFNNKLEQTTDFLKSIN